METEIKQLDTEADLRRSVEEALAVAGALMRRAPLGVFESASTNSGGPSMLFVLPVSYRVGLDPVHPGAWCGTVHAAEQISPGGWVWRTRELPDGSQWIEAEKIFGEGSRSMGLSLMLASDAPDEVRDRAAEWAGAEAWLTHHSVAFGQEAF